MRAATMSLWRGLSLTFHLRFDHEIIGVHFDHVRAGQTFGGDARASVDIHGTRTAAEALTVNVEHGATLAVGAEVVHFRPRSGTIVHTFPLHMLHLHLADYLHDIRQQRLELAV
jgi:hypothetical protein